MRNAKRLCIDVDHERILKILVKGRLPNWAINLLLGFERDQVAGQCRLALYRHRHSLHKLLRINFA